MVTIFKEVSKSSAEINQDAQQAIEKKLTELFEKSDIEFKENSINDTSYSLLRNIKFNRAVKWIDINSSIKDLANSLDFYKKIIDKHLNDAE